jgi:hypothetical protein
LRTFDPAIVRREMQIIRNGLHCDAVRITGGDRGGLETAARHAADAGLEVWYSPVTNGLTQGELLDFLADPQRLRAAVPSLPARINAFLGEAVAAVRAKFGGRIGYASLPHEGVDWAPFDVIATDAGYLCELLDAFDRSAIDAAFVNTFVRYDLPHADADDDRDFDKASFGIVKVLDGGRTGTAYPGLPWEPKAAFQALARYGRSRVQVVADRPTGSGQAAAVSR